MATPRPPFPPVTRIERTQKKVGYLSGQVKVCKPAHPGGDQVAVGYLEVWKCGRAAEEQLADGAGFDYASA
jgi:hypothetical protein